MALIKTFAVRGGLGQGIVFLFLKAFETIPVYECCTNSSEISHLCKLPRMRLRTVPRTSADSYSYIGFYKYRRQQEDFTFSFRRESFNLKKDLERLTKDDAEEISVTASKLLENFEASFFLDHCAVGHRRNYQDIRLFWNDVESLVWGSDLEADKMKAARTITRGTTKGVSTIMEEINAKLIMPA
ncbi:hypothetical protein BC938DRAFT_481862 [Jimgerdemannia flammicorona]|uniref:Uncharacterized protein n=1 Tax=Jimgerdemannia flammicorona TaxID=994334 RepID=A0A433QWM9_9FUNG|nr:hypothetical protein BC938DRAFT_481862 [Jimgerdemannia flammicorona]